MDFNVTQADIDAADKVLMFRSNLNSRCQNCPVAQSLKRTLPKGTSVSVFGPNAFINSKKFRLSKAVMNRIGAYDSDKGMQPFKFQIKDAEKVCG
jgi:hypothetical protein